VTSGLVIGHGSGFRPDLNFDVNNDVNNKEGSDQGSVWVRKQRGVMANWIL
jgi:hypothetical protein